MNRFLFCLAACLFAITLPVNGDEPAPPPEVKRFIDQGEALRQEWLGKVSSFRAQIELSIRLMGRAKFDPNLSTFCTLKKNRYTFRKRSDRDEVKAKYTEMLGYLNNLESKLVNAEGKAAPILRIEEDAVGVADQPFQIIQVIDESNMLASYGRVNVWLEGFPTEGVVDDQRLKLRQSLHVSGTKQYESVLGANNTVRVVKPLDAEKWIGGEPDRVDVGETLAYHHKVRRQIPLPEPPQPKGNR